jgi:hypothetical protein
VLRHFYLVTARSLTRSKEADLKAKGETAMERSGMTSLFYTHGFLCASRPAEVLLLCITGTVCLLTLSIYDATHAQGDSLVPAVTDKVGSVDGTS